MIVGLFVLLVGLALCTLVLGYFTGDQHYAFVGLFFFFLLSMVILTGNLEVESGANVSSSYVYNGSQVVGTSQDVVYVYESWSDSNSRWVGLTLALASGFGMGLYLIEFTKRRRDE